MDREIYQLVKHLDHRGLQGLPYEEQRILLWQRAVQKWNSTHGPAKISLDDVYAAFKNRWPHIYGSAPLDGTLYLSFSYIDYLFSMNSENLICGGIWKRDDERPCEPVNMSAEQIVELSGWLRIVPESLSEWEEDENTIKECEVEINNGSDYKGPDSEKRLYQILQMQAISQYMLGMFEDSIVSLTRAMLCFNRHHQSWNSEATPEQRQLFEVGDAISLAELYTQLADNLVYTFHWTEAEWCYKLAYMQRLNVYEQNDWLDYEYRYMAKADRKHVGQDKRCIYLNWAWNFAQLYIKENRKEQAIPILKKAEMVAMDMNEKDNGKWSENLKSITKKIKELETSEHNHE